MIKLIITDKNSMHNNEAHFSVFDEVVYVKIDDKEVAMRKEEFIKLLKVVESE
jgi:hypothetical protein